MREIGPLTRPPGRPGGATGFRPRHLRTSAIPAGGDPVTGRRPLLYNDQVALRSVRPTETADFFYRNGEARRAALRQRRRRASSSRPAATSPTGAATTSSSRAASSTASGPEPGEQRLPRGAEPRAVSARPSRYRNQEGQHLRVVPVSASATSACRSTASRSTRRASSRSGSSSTAPVVRVVYARHPFDVVGWDGYYYPWAINVEDFEPIVGRIHQPPPVHQIFEADGFVRLQLRAAPLRLPPRGGPGALPPHQRRHRRGPLLRQRAIHEPPGDRVRIDHPAPRRHSARAASRHDRAEPRQDRNGRAGRHDRHLPPAHREPRGRGDRGPRLPAFLARSRRRPTGPRPARSRFDKRRRVAQDRARAGER